MIIATQVRDTFKSRLAQITVLGLLTSWAMSFAIAEEAGNRLENITAQALPGNKVEVSLVLSGPAPEPLAFTIDQPARIALDLADTTLGLESRRTDVGIGVLDTVLAAQAGGRTRVVLNLDDLVGYQTRVAGNTVIVTLESPVATNADVTQFAASVSGAAPTPKGARAIESIDFRRTEAGGGRVIITMSDDGIPVDVRQEGGQVVVNFEGTALPDSLLKRYDVLDFATPVSSIDSVRVDNDARLVIAARGAYEELAYQTDRVFTVEIQPVAAKEGPASATIYSGDKEYSGERLTLNFQDIDSRAVLQLLADISGRNIVVSDTVEGNVTLRLQNVPWDQAMDIVLATKGLDMRENGNVIIVAPADEIAAREKADLESRQEIRELEPLFSEFVQVNYAKASDLAELLGESGKGAIMSERGSVAIDERTNTLLVKDTANNIADIRRLVATLDVPVRQVLIESRIVVVNDDFSRDLGVRWGFTGVDSNGSNGLVAVSGTGAGTDSYVQAGLDNIANGDPVLPINGVPNLSDRYNVRLPIANPAGSFAMAVLDDDYLIDLEITAAQAEGNTEVISSPRVITANQKEAKIVQGVEIPYQESSSSGATSTQFKEALLSLTVTPQITPDDRIIMDLIVSKDSVGEIIVTENGAQPSIDTREVITQVLVENGQTVVLGGIYETESGEFETKVPFLGDIPVLGNLFKSTRRISNKSELLVFVTPKILKEGSTIY